MATEEKYHFTEICHLLQSSSFNNREAGVKQIDEYISRLGQTEEQISKLWDFVSNPLLKALVDSFSKCRFEVLKTIKKFITKLPKEDKYIIYLLPILSGRLDSSEFKKTSEEVRLMYVELLNVIITKYGDSLAPVVKYLERILTLTMLDPYPEAKTASLYCVSNFAKSLPKHFYSVSQSFVKPILANLKDRQFKVRQVAVLAIGDCIRYGHSESLEEVANPLAQRLLDEIHLVREAVIGVARDWLVHLPDRYGWWHKILPLLLPPLFDECDNDLAEKYWDQVGKLYLKENEEDEKLKSKLDFLNESRPHYPANVTRPNLGCRVIAQQTFPKLINGICLELGDWLVNVRVQAALLLRAFLLNVEEEATQHIAKLLPAMYRACKKEENTRVVENVEIAAEYIGCFVPPETYCRLMIATFEEGLSEGHLAIFSAVLKGSERSTLTPMLCTIGDFLQKPNVCQSNEKAYQERMLECCNSLISVCGKDCEPISDKLFRVIFTVLAMTEDERIEREANRLLNILTEISSFANVREYCGAHIESLLLSLPDCKSWSNDTAEAKIFSACLVHIEGILSRYNLLFLDILRETTNAKADPLLRLKHFTLLSRYFNEALWQERMDPRHANRFLADCIIPNLIWSAGKTAEAIRVAAVSCFQNFLLHCDKNDVELDAACNALLIDRTIPLLISLADDNSKMARLYSVNTLRCLVHLVKRHEEKRLEEWVYKMYPVLLRRLDDGSDDVRKASLAALTETWKSIPADNSIMLNGVHVDTLYTALLIYLDDSDANFQASVLDCLKKLAVVHPRLLHTKLTNCRNNFKNQESLDILTQHCHDMLPNE